VARDGFVDRIHVGGHSLKVVHVGIAAAAVLADGFDDAVKRNHDS
jgi:hypothetical protein